MPQPIIAITRQIPDAGMQMLKKKGYKVRLNPHDRALSRDELKSLVKDATAILSLLTDRIDAEIMDAAGANLCIISNYAVGYDNIDLKEAAKRGIVVTNTPGVPTQAVAEHTLALIFACAKRIPEADRFTRAEKYQGWTPMLFLGKQLRGKTLGIVGLGRIGYEVAMMCGFGLQMKILYNDIKRDHEFEKKFRARYATLSSLLKRSDVVTLHVPLLPSTRHLISRKEIALMKQDAILINTSRGPVVDEKALASALKNRRIFAAGIDVFECEPAIDCDISDDLELKKLENVVMTPHTASATIEARDQMARLAAENIIRALSGKKPKTPVKE